MSKKNNTNWSRSEIVELWIIILVFVFAIGQYVYNSSWTWIHIPLIRNIFHAVSAIVLAMLVNFVGMFWILIVRELLGIWITTIYPLVQQKKVLKVARRKINKILIALQPFTVVFYIIYAYNWENYQAEYYNRQFQTGQFVIDIVFSVIGAIIWVKHFKGILPKTYSLKPSDVVYFGNIIFCYIEDEFSKKISRIIEKILIVIVLLIPIIIILLLIVFFKLIPWW